MNLRIKIISQVKTVGKWMGKTAKQLQILSKFQKGGQIVVALERITLIPINSDRLVLVFQDSVQIHLFPSSDPVIFPKANTKFFVG